MDSAYTAADDGRLLVEDTLVHFGRKGMKWGQRIFSKGESAAPAHPHSSDAQRHAETKAKLKSGGVHSLSTQELRDYTNRADLEKRLAGLREPSAAAAAAKFGGKIVGDILLNVGKQQITKALNDAVGKELAKATKK